MVSRWVKEEISSFLGSQSHIVECDLQIIWAVIGHLVGSGDIRA
jgi:hypothetical protein